MRIVTPTHTTRTHARVHTRTHTHTPPPLEDAGLITFPASGIFLQVLAEMAVTEPYSFRAVVETVKAKGSPQA